MVQLENYNKTFPKLFNVLVMAYQTVTNLPFVTFVDTLVHNHKYGDKKPTTDSLMFEVELK